MKLKRNSWYGKIRVEHTTHIKRQEQTTTMTHNNNNRRTVTNSLRSLSTANRASEFNSVYSRGWEEPRRGSSLPTGKRINSQLLPAHATRTPLPSVSQKKKWKLTKGKAERIQGCHLHVNWKRQNYWKCDKQQNVQLNCQLRARGLQPASLTDVTLKVDKGQEWRQPLACQVRTAAYGNSYKV